MKSGAKPTFRPARYGDIAAIWPTMDPIERLEVEAFGHSAKGGLRLAYRGSAMAWTAELDGRPEAMFGVMPEDLCQGIGRPWMLRTVKAEKAGKAWLVDAAAFLSYIETVFPRLENWVHVDNVASIRWLSRLGFAIDPETVHIGEVPFRRFHRGF